tara:strand:- start:2639 stop:4132 length:1494 start_codon:yes stop_codon:yes gene_type:complete
VIKKNILNLIQNQCKKKPNHIFLEDIDGRKFDLKKIYSFILKFNNFINKKKIKHQTKIFVILENSNLLTLLFLAITSSQRIFVPINPSSGNDEINYIFKKLKPKIIITEKLFIKKIPKNFKKKIIEIKSEDKFISEIFKNKDKRIKLSNINNIAEILFSSGSTGKPKAIVLTHASMMHNLIGIYKQIKFEKNKNYLAVTPVYHNNGQFIPTLIPLLTFGKTIPVNSLASIANFWNLIKLKNINYSSVMVTHINYLYYNKIKTTHNLKALFCGGAKLDLDIQKKFSAFFKVRVLTNYGLTETSSIAATETFNNFNTGSAGKPLFNNQIKINKLKVEEYGEVLIKGKNIFKKYYGQKKITNKKLRSGWFSTGDLGSFDKKGNLFIKDRLDSMFVVSGENIYPNEIENYANNFSGIKNSFVTSVLDKITSKKIVIIYEGKKKISIDKLNLFLSKKISNFKLPKKIWHISDLKIKEIPKAPNGKILRNKFNELLRFNKGFN